MTDDLDARAAADPPLVDRSAADELGRDHRPPDTAGRSRRRIAGWALLALAGLLATYYLATLAQVAHTGGSHGADRGDAIIVMGAAQYDGRPSPQLAARLDHVVTLWNDGVAPVVVVTGGNIPGDRFTEAEASAAYLIERGVPAASIVEVGSGNTTHESVVAAAPVMEAAGIETVVLVTDPYHALRSRLIVESEGFEVDVAATPNSVVTGRSSFRRQVTEAGGVALGRLIGFDRVSDLAG